LVTKPIEKVELQARVEILRSRQLSVQLKAANQDLQSEITERQRVEAALAKSEKFRALVQNSSDVIRVRSGWYSRICKPSAKMFLGFSQKKGGDAFDFIHT